MSGPRPGWPATLTSGLVRLRPVKARDFTAWREIRLRNEDWLAQWEPTSPQTWADRHTFSSFMWQRREMRRAARDGLAMPFVMCVDGDLAGQVNIGPILRGPLCSGDIGYWIDEKYAGRGLMPQAVAMATLHALGEGRLHRVAAVVRPENAASLRVVEKVGFRREGDFKNYLDIDGGWRDHVAFAVTAEDNHTRLTAIAAGRSVT